MYQLPIEYKSSICEIKTLQNELLSTGVITAIDPEYVEISGKTGVMPLLRFRDEVKLSVFNHKYGFRVLSALVYISNRKFVRVFDTQSIMDYERRNFFRVDTKIFAEIQLLREPDTKEPIPKQKAVVCNLSLGGVLLLTKIELKEDEIIQLYLPINDMNCIFTCRVHRVEQEKPDHWSCSCEFFEYSDKQSNILCVYLFQCQRNYLNKL